mmetsp:Transcript_2419/g.6539  ORF Transcript_2419/g.6539 Transcript_2419/m.6539 type:complete len:80 (+) Transcript_2419:409-648(+)
MHAVLRDVRPVLREVSAVLNVVRAERHAPRTLCAPNLPRAVRDCIVRCAQALSVSLALNGESIACCARCSKYISAPRAS